MVRRRRSRSRRTSSRMSGLMRTAYGIAGYKILGRKLLDKVPEGLASVGITGVSPALAKTGAAGLVKTFFKNKWVSPIADAALYIEGDKALDEFNIGGIFNTSAATQNANAIQSTADSGDAWRN